MCVLGKWGGGWEQKWNNKHCQYILDDITTFYLLIRE